MKRLFDIMMASLGLIVLSPVFLMVAVSIKLDSPGPVFYRQVRVGRYGLPFRIFKFRTMTAAPAHAATGPELTVAGDARITRVGAVLRRYKIDELAQLIDVLRGTMSLVGPRPEVPRYVAAYSDEQRQRVLSVRPGITDFASLKFRDENALLAQASDPEVEYRNVILPEKLRVSMDYVDFASLSTDMRVLGLTLRTVFVPEGAAKAMKDVIQHQALWGRVERLFAWAHTQRRWLAWIVDAFVILAAWHVTYLFRLGVERWEPERPWYDDWVSLGVIVVYLLFLQWGGVRRSMWRYFAFDDFRRLWLACVLAGVTAAFAVRMCNLVGVPRAVLVLHPLFALFGLALVRMGYRMVQEHASALAQGDSGASRYVIILGAGDLARRLVAGLHQRHGWHVMMLLDDDADLHGVSVAGVRVAGGMELLRDPSLTFGATHVILAVDECNTELVAKAAALAQSSQLVVMRVPEPA